MIDPVRDNIYNIILSIFLGVVLIIAFNFLHDSPRTVIILSDRSEPFDSKCLGSFNLKSELKSNQINHIQ